MKPSNLDKWRWSAISGVIFFIVANPWTFKTVQGLVGEYIQVLNNYGSPTNEGLVLHTIVFILILRAWMELKKMLKMNNLKYK
jgi:hypothetical protein